jgi:hypothetical protein
MSETDISRPGRIRIGCSGQDRKEHVMPRVYHNSAVGRALPMAGPDRKVMDVPDRQIGPRHCDPVDTGLPITPTIMLTREEL